MTGRLGELARRRPWETLLFAILVGTVVFNVLNSKHYVGVGNFVNLFELSIEKVIVAVIMTFVIVAGEIDLSVASTMGLSAAVLATLHHRGAVPFGLAIVIAIAVGVAAGLVQGWCVARLGLPSLVVTLAGLIGLRGAARIFIEDKSYGDFPGWFNRLGQRNLVGPLPLSVIVFGVGIVIAGVVLARTPLGRRLYVIGDNPEVARYSGIDVARTRIVLFAVSGGVAAFAGIVYAAGHGSVRGDLAEGFELDIITMVLLGGVSIFGGSGTMVGVGLAILIVLNLRNGLGLAHVDSNTQTGVIGVILIVSVIARNGLDRLRTRWDRLAPLDRGADPVAGTIGSPS